MQKMPAPFFPIFESFIGGIRLLVENRRLILLLSFFPFVLALCTLVFMRLIGDQLPLFMLPVVQLPSSFVTGLQCALLLRFLVLGEYPVAIAGDARAARNRAILHSAVAYAAISYFVSGIYVLTLKGQAMAKVNPEAVAPYMPLALFMLMAVMWGARWFWLHIPLALDWSVSDMYTRIGKWRGSFGVFSLFASCSLAVNFMLSIFRTTIHLALGNISPGMTAAFDDSILACANILLAVLFTVTSIMALKILTAREAEGRKP